MKRLAYATGTTVPTVKTRQEIEELLRRQGAEDVVVAELRGRAVVTWAADGLRFAVAHVLPPHEDYPVLKKWDQALRSAWRGMLLLIRGRLFSVGEGLESWQDAFLNFVTLPSGDQLGDVLGAQVQEAYRTGGVPRLLAGQRLLGEGKSS